MTQAKLGWLTRLLGRKEEAAMGAPVVALSDEALIKNIVALQNIPLKDIMVPRSEILWIRQDASLEEVKALAQGSSLDQVPVCQDTMEHVVGVVSFKDLLAEEGHFSVRKMVKKGLFVSPSLPVTNLLTRMAQKDQTIALVVDEYGAVDGLVSLRRVMAEMVSTIEDVTDHLQSPLMEPLENGAFIVDGRISVAQLEKALHASFADGGAAPEVETVAGLVMHLATRVPKPGSVLKHPNGTEFLVLEASPRKVKRLKVTKAP